MHVHFTKLFLAGSNKKKCDPNFFKLLVSRKYFALIKTEIDKKAIYSHDFPK